MDAEVFQYAGYTLHEAIDGLMAYDAGFTDSGIRDESLKEALRNYLHKLSEKEQNRVLSEHARSYLTDEKIRQGYGIESVKEIINWLSWEMNIDL